MVVEGGKGENPLLFSLTARKVGGVSRLRFPPGPHLRSSRFSRHPRLRQASSRRFAIVIWVVFVGPSFVGRAPSPGGPGPKPPGDLAHRPLGPGSRRVDFLQACYHNPQSAWMVSEGGPQGLGDWRPGPQAPGAWIPPLSPLTSCKPATITPNPLAGRWMVSEGGALQSHERRG